MGKVSILTFLRPAILVFINLRGHYCSIEGWVEDWSPLIIFGGMFDHVVLEAVYLLSIIPIIWVEWLGLLSEWCTVMIAFMTMRGFHILLSGSVCLLEMVLDSCAVIVRLLDTEVIIVSVVRVLPVMLITVGVILICLVAERVIVQL